jgi:hypothetical protein
MKILVWGILLGSDFPEVYGIFKLSFWSIDHVVETKYSTTMRVWEFIKCGGGYF